MVNLISYYVTISGDNFDIGNYLQTALFSEQIKVDIGNKILLLSLLETDERSVYGQDILMETLKNQHEAMHTYGGSEIVFYYAFEYIDQCNVEFEPEHLKLISKIGGCLAVSCYKSE
ncbi:MAG: hypothetical protein IPM61_11065 [Chlorobi bacterium]|nr:hypothetical protein [Chlorobiota bacterium]MBX7215503.1 hypothetical protein [Candidatus Kapabacteria bacterium]